MDFDHPRTDSKVEAVPLSQRQAKEKIAQLQPERKTPIRGVIKYVVGAQMNNRLVGAAICVQPTEELTIEVARLATDGTKDAERLLYVTCADIAKEMGFDKTQTLLEPGASTNIKSRGWVLEEADCQRRWVRTFNKKEGTMATTTDPLSDLPDTAPGPPEPAKVSGWDTEERWQQRKQSLIAKYEALDTKLCAYGDAIALTIDQAIPTLAEMEAFLSRKGRNKLGGIAEELLVMNFPKWGEYLNSYAEKYGLSVRSLQRRLHEYRGETNETHPKRNTPKVKNESSDEQIARFVAERNQRQEKNDKRQEKVPVIEETLASQLCKEGAHLARLVKDLRVPRETLIKWADAYLAKLHGNQKKPVVSEGIEDAEDEETA